MPVVLNMSTYPGRVVPAGGVYIGRAVTRGDYRLAESKWANPFREGRDGTHAEVVAKRDRVCDQPDLMAALPELRGFDLVCWCWPKACHGGVLIGLANGQTHEQAGKSLRKDPPAVAWNVTRGRDPSRSGQKL